MEPYHFACPDCWWQLPAGIRDTITATHGRDPDSQVEVMLSAIAWYREELPRAPIGDESCIEVVAGRYDDEREAERRVLDVVRDLFAVLRMATSARATRRRWVGRSSRRGRWSRSTRGRPTAASHASGRTGRDVHAI